MYFDSHAHYDHARFNKDREILLESLPTQGVVGIINAGCDVATSQKSIALAETYSYIYATVGVHPHEAQATTDADWETLEKLCAHPKVVAVGEAGLDYHYDHSPRDVQRVCFQRQLALALRVGLPIVVHSREAAAETMDILQASGVRSGVLHCYSGNVPMALAYVQMGFMIGIGGVVTFDKTKKALAVVEQVPLDKLLIETDAPYLTPQPNRGRRNDSSQLEHVVKAIAHIKGLPPETVAEATAHNVKTLFPQIA